MTRGFSRRRQFVYHFLLPLKVFVESIFVIDTGRLIAVVAGGSILQLNARLALILAQLTLRAAGRHGKAGDKEERRRAIEDPVHR
jgi:hypothetical protein